MINIQQVTLNYLRWAPFSLAIREVTRINALKIFNDKTAILSSPSILDVGCGDGKWWTYLLPDRFQEVAGVDINPDEIELARKHIKARCLDVSSSEFLEQMGDQTFDLIIGNCSIEHIFHIDHALKNIHAKLNDDGVFVLFVPTPFWALKGKSVGLLNAISPRLAMSFSGLLNGFFQHWHLYNYRIWISLLSSFNFKVAEVYGLGNSRSEYLFRLHLPFAFVSFLVKTLTGRYLSSFLSFITPSFIHKWNTRRLLGSLDSSLRPANDPEIFEYMLVCRK